MTFAEFWRGLCDQLACGREGEPYVVETAALSDIGCERSENQDRVRVLNLHEGGGLSVAGMVADGMGGEWGGGRAAELAIEAVVARLREEGGGAPLKTLRRAFEAANDVILAESHAAPHGRGMGTTLTVAWLCGGLLYCGHVGDSRLYRLRDGRIVQLSKDHSLIGDMLRAGLITEEEARHHPDRNVISRAVGKRTDMEPDVWCEKDSPRLGDRYLLCSDGLHGLIGDADLLAAVSGHEPDAACAHLVDLARSAGGHDNISAALMVLRAVVDADRDAGQTTRHQISAVRTTP
jgi:protein phosphatase